MMQLDFLLQDLDHIKIWYLVGVNIERNKSSEKKTRVFLYIQLKSNSTFVQIFRTWNIGN